MARTPTFKFHTPTPVEFEYEPDADLWIISRLMDADDLPMPEGLVIDRDEHKNWISMSFGPGKLKANAEKIEAYLREKDAALQKGIPEYEGFSIERGVSGELHISGDGIEHLAGELGGRIGPRIGRLGIGQNLIIPASKSESALSRLEELVRTCSELNKLDMPDPLFLKRDRSGRAIYGLRSSKFMIDFEGAGANEIKANKALSAFVSDAHLQSIRIPCWKVVEFQRAYAEYLEKASSPPPGLMEAITELKMRKTPALTGGDGVTRLLWRHVGSLLVADLPDVVAEDDLMRWNNKLSQSGRRQILFHPEKRYRDGMHRFWGGMINGPHNGPEIAAMTKKAKLGVLGYFLRPNERISEIVLEIGRIEKSFWDLARKLLAQKNAPGIAAE